jgi:16S rRNA (cytidine1402-2'-O)-methyltransferase
VLGEVDVIACEDTRRTGSLLSRSGVVGPRLLSFFAGNEARRLPEVLDLLRAEANVALVTDAGMPGVSDPGFAMVRAAVEAGVDVRVVPGPSAVTAALAVSGLASDRFVFEGFLPRSGRDRGERLAALAEERRTVVLFESPRRVVSTLADLRRSSGERRIAVCRELTKLHEEVLRGTVLDVERELARRADVKGEIVIVLEGASPPVVPEADAVAVAMELVAGGMRKRDAARRAAAGTGVPARALYAALVEATGS